MLNEHPQSSFKEGRKGSEHKTTPTKVSFCVSRMWDGKKKMPNMKPTLVGVGFVFSRWWGIRKTTDHEKTPTRVSFHVWQV